MSLSLKRKVGQAIYLEVPGIDEPIVIRVDKCASCQLVVTAPESVYIRREELVPEDRRIV